jgi:hypothetical protein
MSVVFCLFVLCFQFGIFSGILDDLTSQKWYFMGDDRSDDPDQFRVLATFPHLNGESVLNMNINWDGVANVVLVAPGASEPVPSRHAAASTPTRMFVRQFSESIRFAAKATF